MICLSASVLSYWLRFEKVCCKKASPAGEGSFSLECFRTQKLSSDALSLMADREAQTEATEAKASTSAVF